MSKDNHKINHLLPPTFGPWPTVWAPLLYSSSLWNLYISNSASTHRLSSNRSRRTLRSWGAVWLGIQTLDCPVAFNTRPLHRIRYAPLETSACLVPAPPTRHSIHPHALSHAAWSPSQTRAEPWSPWSSSSVVVGVLSAFFSPSPLFSLAIS